MPANLGEGAQIIMRLHELVKLWGFSRLNQTNTEVVQEHSGGSRVDQQELL